MHAGMAQRYGADINRAQFVRLAIALCIGTLLECEFLLWVLATCCSAALGSLVVGLTSCLPLHHIMEFCLNFLHYPHCMNPGKV